MDESKPKNKTLKYLYFFGGICLCLFSVTLIMNVWYIARAITFIPAYLFGVGAYGIFLFIYALGMSFLFREKGIHFKSKLTVLGLVLLFFAIVIGISAGFANSENPTISEFNHCLGNFKQYASFRTKKPLAFISDFNFNADPIEGTLPDGEKTIHFGGGVIGIAIVNGLGKLGTFGKILTWLMVVVFALLGIFLMFKKPIINFVKKSFPNSSKKSGKNKNDEEFNRVMDSLPVAVSAEARLYHSVSNGLNRESAPASVPTSAPLTGNEPPMEKRKPMVSQVTPVSYNSNAYANIGVFTPARFNSSRFGNSQPVSQPQMNNEPNPYVQKPFAPAPTPVAPAPAPEPVERKVEQTYLDFDEKPQVNETLVRAQPTFQEPVFQQPVQPQPAVNPYASQQIPVKKAVKWVPPSSDMLETLMVDAERDENNAVAEERLAAINGIFQDFKIGAQVEGYTVGPSVTRYNIKYDPNVSAKAIERIVDDISIRLGGVSARFEAVVEGQYTSGLEIPNAKITPVSFKEVYEKLPDVKKHPLAVAFGKSINGDVICADFNDFPHILVAGTTGSGKSVFVNSLITSLIMRNSPDDLKLVLIDPKQVEFSKYRDIPHLLCPVINDATQAKLVLQKLVDEMNDRYAAFNNAEGCTSLKEYNEYASEHGLEKMPFIIVFVDEYADLVDTCKEIGQPVVMIGQKARACGIHMLIATQRPSTNVVTGVIKGNLPTHVALMTSSAVDSCTIVNEGGAEKLLGKGDMLVQTPLVSRIGMVRLQSCFIQRKEMVYVVGYLKEHYETHYNEKFMNLEDSSAQAGRAAVAAGEVAEQYDGAEEERYQAIKEWVTTQQYMSISRIQRECSVGFNRAGRFFLRMQAEGVVAQEVEANKGCRVLQPEEAEYISSSDELSHIG